MKPFNLEEAKSMTTDEVMAEVCEGLAQVCEMMRDDPHFSRLQEKELDKHAVEFRAFGRFYSRKVIDAKQETKHE
jgi:hypothetical protein